MKIKVNMKQIGAKRPKVCEVDFILEKTPHTVKELITEAVHTCVGEYNGRFKKGDTVSSPLSYDEIEKMSEIGKIAFGINYGEKEADEKKAVETAIQAYEDGIVRIFIDENEAEQLDDKIELTENSCVTFIKLAMLSGRMW